MAYIGNTPAEAFSAFQKQDFTTSATTSYTLDHPVSNQNEIALFINFVRQEPTAAYTASGTTLTLTSATSSSDDMYCVYLGKAVQTVNPASGSVGSSQVAASIITGQTALGATPADTDELLISDAGTLKRVDYSYLKSANTPAFEAYLGGSGGQSVSDNTVTLVQANTEVYDTDSAYDTSTYRFTPQTAGKYFVYGSIQYEAGSNDDLIEDYLYFKLNGSNILETQTDFSDTRIRLHHVTGSMVVDMNGSSDYVELYGRINTASGSGQIFESNTQYKRATHFGAYRIIT